jgi:hypothetical protein
MLVYIWPVCRWGFSDRRLGCLLWSPTERGAHALRLPRADSSARITSSTFAGSMMASQINGGLRDIHTVPRTTVTSTVASTPCMLLTRTRRGIPRPAYMTCPSVTAHQIFSSVAMR